MIAMFSLGFITTLLGTIAGSGGLISFPAMVLFGIPVQSTIAANKFNNTCSSLTSLTTLIKKYNSLSKVQYLYYHSAFLGERLVES